jgi:predicted nucleic acid-binding protein
VLGNNVELSSTAEIRFSSMRFFADTNVVSRAARDESFHRRWMAERNAWITNGFSYAVCPLVLIELLYGLAHSEPAFFSHQQKRLQAYASVENIESVEMLPFPGAFMLATVLGVRSPVTTMDAQEFRRWFKIAVCARSLSELTTGRVELGATNSLQYGLNMDFISDQHERGVGEHLKVWERVRALQLPLPSRNDWAAAKLRAHGIVPTVQDVDLVGRALDAVFFYYTFLYKEALRPSYRFDKHHGDWVDNQLLYYLADPGLRVITCDVKFKKRIAGSIQAERLYAMK